MAKKKKIAVVLSGSGHRDGSEITEAASVLIALDKEGAEYSIFAPSITVPTINHLDEKEEGTHNVLVESARIARGKIQPLDALDESLYDALILPGGTGAAMHLSTWAKAGAKCTVLPALEKAILAFHASSKPIGAVCIAPVIVARVLGKHQVALTIGNDKETAAEIEKTGALHEECPVDDYVTDRLNKVMTTPAYKHKEATPFKVFTGISKLVREFVEMA